MTHRERIRAAARGETADLLPYVPRIDLWYNANKGAGTLPEKYKNSTQDEISRAEGWALHKVLPDLLDLRDSEDTLHRGIGVFSTRHSVHRFRFSDEIDIRVKTRRERTRIEYHTPVGMVSTTTVFPEELRKAGSTLSVVKEHAVKSSADYAVLAYIFENIHLEPYYDDFLAWQEEIGEDGYCCAFAGLASSPMHHIQKDFLSATEFYYHYHDYRKEMERLKEALEHYYSRLLEIVAGSPADGIFWGGNFDEMITYPPYFEKEILPWLQKAGEALHRQGKILDCHCDGENQGLLDLIAKSNMDIAEAICPHPMTKVKIDDYYEAWCDKLTIFGGIPSNLLLPELTSEDEFEAYLDHLFKAIAPGTRFILGIADTTPPGAAFDRLVRIGERVGEEGKLPLETGAVGPQRETQSAPAAVPPESRDIGEDPLFRSVQEDIFRGDELQIESHILTLIQQDIDPQDILQQGMIAAMEVIGPKFKAGELFIPEVLLSARAMNRGMAVLEPYLSPDRKRTGKVVLGTVKGDLHDIGKNMVATMLRGVGYDVVDMGVDVAAGAFVEAIQDHNPSVLGLSALLTTTMPEMRKVIDALAAAGLRGEVAVAVGGAPVNARYAREIGADGYAGDAADAVDLVQKMMEKQRSSL